MPTVSPIEQLEKMAFELCDCFPFSPCERCQDLIPVLDQVKQQINCQHPKSHLELVTDDRDGGAVTGLYCRLCEAEIPELTQEV